MSILLVDDGSSYSEISATLLEALQLPSQTNIIVMTVVPEQIFLGDIFSYLLGEADQIYKASHYEISSKSLKNTVQTLSNCGYNVQHLVRWGNPAQEILKVADEINASLIVMGARGLSDTPAFRLGSVTQTVMKHARTSVLISKKKTLRINVGMLTGNTSTNIDRVLIATDGSTYSDAVIQFLLDLPLPHHTEVMIVTTLHSHSAAMLKIPALGIEYKQKFLADLQAAEEKEAIKILTRSCRQFEEKGYKTSSEILRDGVFISILKAVEAYNPDIIALGSNGLTPLESLFLGGLGSVSERVSRNAPCSILIVKPPKQ